MPELVGILQTEVHFSERWLEGSEDIFLAVGILICLLWVLLGDLKSAGILNYHKNIIEEAKWFSLEIYKVAIRIRG